MSALVFAVMSLVAVRLSDAADNSFGESVFAIGACLLFACALLLAPWGEVFA